MKTIDQLDLAGRRVLIRVDYNVPLDKSGDVSRITDDSRIRAGLETVRHAADSGARVILTSHMGRPKGQRVPPRGRQGTMAGANGSLRERPSCTPKWIAMIETAGATHWLGTKCLPNARL